MIVTLHHLREKELTVPKNIREYCLQTLQFQKTHGDSVCKPYQFSQLFDSRTSIGGVWDGFGDGFWGGFWDGFWGRFWGGFWVIGLFENVNFI